MAMCEYPYPRIVRVCHCMTISLAVLRIARPIHVIKEQVVTHMAAETSAVVAFIMVIARVVENVVGHTGTTRPCERGFRGLDRP
jgi:hypothetical protein